MSNIEVPDFVLRFCDRKLSPEAMRKFMRDFWFEAANNGYLIGIEEYSECTTVKNAEKKSLSSE